jgi:hypothetical protein
MNENIPTTSLTGAKFTMSIVCVNPRDPKDKMEFRDVTELNNKLFDLKEQHDFYKSKWEDKNNNVFRVIGLEQQVAQLTGLQVETLNERNKAEAKLEEVSQEYRDATNHYNKLHDDLVKENERLKAEIYDLVRAGNYVLGKWGETKDGDHSAWSDASYTWNAAKKGRVS